MSIRILISLSLFLYILPGAFGQMISLEHQIDSILAVPTSKPFNGVILISQNGKTIYSKTMGYANVSDKIPLQLNDQFVIGSISKQITALLVLQEYDKGHLKLDESIYTYLPELKKRWQDDTITIQQLLSHTHGIVHFEKPLKFKPGTQFEYSQIGYEILSQIFSKTSGQSFAIAVNKLFQECNMRNSQYPDFKENSLVKGYNRLENDTVVFELHSLENYAAAGSLISTAPDLVKWNTCLHEGKLIRKDTYKKMISKQKNAIRQHPIFGETFYGLGPTISDESGILQLGQSGFAPGFASINFYFPDTKTSIIILENVINNESDFKNIFLFHTSILQLVKQAISSTH